MINSSTKDKLSEYLEEHGFSELYEPLKSNGCELKDLKNLQLGEVDEFSIDIGLKVIQKLKLRRLMQIIIADRDNITVSSRAFGVVPVYKMNVVLVGDMGVGKTNLMRKHVEDVFDEKSTSSVGVDHAIDVQKVSDGNHIKITIWY